MRGRGGRFRAPGSNCERDGGNEDGMERRTGDGGKETDQKGHDDVKIGRRAIDRSGTSFREDRTSVREGGHLREWGVQCICSRDKCFPSRYSLKIRFAHFGIRVCMEGCAKLLPSLHAGTNDAASQRCWYKLPGRAATRGRAEFVGEESQRDAGMKMLTTENTQLLKVTSEPTTPRWCRLENSTGTCDSFESVFTVVGEHVVLYVFDISIAQHCLSRVMGAVLC